MTSRQLENTTYWRPTRHAHAFSLLITAWLMGFAYYRGFGDPDPAAQNHLVVGLLVLMFAMIPTHAERPPVAWDHEHPHHPSQSIANG